MEKRFIEDVLTPNFIAWNIGSEKNYISPYKEEDIMALFVIPLITSLISTAAATTTTVGTLTTLKAVKVAGGVALRAYAYKQQHDLHKAKTNKR